MDACTTRGRRALRLPPSNREDSAWWLAEAKETLGGGAVAVEGLRFPAFCCAWTDEGAGSMYIALAFA